MVSEWVQWHKGYDAGVAAGETSRCCPGPDSNRPGRLRTRSDSESSACARAMGATCSASSRSIRAAATCVARLVELDPELAARGRERAARISPQLEVVSARRVDDECILGRRSRRTSCSCAVSSATSPTTTSQYTVQIAAGPVRARCDGDLDARNIRAGPDPGDSRVVRPRTGSRSWRSSPSRTPRPAWVPAGSPRSRNHSCPACRLFTFLSRDRTSVPARRALKQSARGFVWRRLRDGRVPVDDHLALLLGDHLRRADSSPGTSAGCRPAGPGCPSASGRARARRTGS